MKNTGNKLVAMALALLMVSGSLVNVSTISAEPIGDPNFGVTWERTDAPVHGGQANRTWMWGPEAHSETLYEPYSNAPGGMRFVQYFDKSRMEINDRDADVFDEWYVTNGLLALEMMTGRMQLGDQEFIYLEPAEVNIAGDGDDPNGPTYESFATLLDREPHPAGHTITEVLERSGNIRQDPGLASYGVTAREFVPATNNYVASVFWDFMNSEGLLYSGSAQRTGRLFQNPYYATGLPVTEAYWTEVRVAGQQRTVLVQAFERRVLTYTPDNPDGWKVEAGNVGMHYYRWRYDRFAICPVNTMIQDPTHEWSYPRATIIAASQHYGRNAAVSGLADNSLQIRGMYHLLYSPVGCYNSDTTLFQEMSLWYVGWLYGQVTIDTPEMRNHVRAQIHHAIYLPDTPIAQRMRTLQAGGDPHIAQNGPEVYWDHLIAEYAFSALDPISYQSMRNMFEIEIDNYRTRHFRGDVSFGEHLAESRFVERWFHISPGDH